MSLKTFMRDYGKTIVICILCLIIIITMILLYVYNNKSYSNTTTSASAPAPVQTRMPTPAPTRNVLSEQEIYSEQEHLMPGHDSELPNYSLIPTGETAQLPSLDDMIKGIKKMNDELTEFNKNLDVPGSLKVVNDIIGKGLDELMNNPGFQYLMADQNFAEIFELLIKTANRLDNNNRHKLKEILDQLFRIMIKINNGLVA